MAPAVPAALLAALLSVLVPGQAEAGVSPLTTAEGHLRFALAVLCPRCSNDVEAEGVNRAMRRAILAGPALEAARDAVEVAGQAGGRRAAAAGRPIGRALQALESVDEQAAARQARRALRMLESLPR
jgi:hypothetical protein